MDLRARYRKHGPIGFVRWLLIKRVGRGILVATDRFFARQSLVGDPAVIDAPGRLPRAKLQMEVLAPRGGYLRAVRARPIGHATMLLGAGRSRVDSAINPAVGAVLHKKVGERVEAGEPLCTILADDEGRARELALPILSGAYAIGDEPVEVPELIVVNKADAADPMVIARLRQRERHSVVVSAKTGEGIEEALRLVESELPRPGVEFKALLPYERGDLIDRLHRNGEIDSMDHTAEGTLVAGRAHEDLAGELAAYAV